MSGALYLKIKSDRKYYEDMYSAYKDDFRKARQTELMSQLRTVIAALKKLETMH